MYVFETANCKLVTGNYQPEIANRFQLYFSPKIIFTMKTKLLFIACCMLFACYAINSNAQSANRTLSNLISPTAVNQSLLPGTSNTINLGSGGRGALSWNNLYLGNALYLKGKITLHAPGTGNFFVGVSSGNASLTGLYNSGIGQFSLVNLTSGTGNTANGYQALYRNTEGAYNKANGYKALYSNTTGDNNIACGLGSLSNNDGSGNTANGNLALTFNTTGNFNSALGYASLNQNTTGFNNTALGSEADVSKNNLFNATAIGSGAKVDASNKVRIGDGSVKSIGGAVEWTKLSDGRYKKNIKENVVGLAFINSLRPITYTVNIQGLNEYYNKGRKQLLSDSVSANEEAVNAEMKKAEDEASKIVYNGFIAQEVEETAKKLNYEFSGVDKPQSKDGVYGLRYAEFVVPLVKAVQELSKMNDALQKQNDEQQKEIDELKAIVLGNNQNNISPRDKTDIKITDASLAQNAPNPFTNTTTISYSLPSKFTTAQIIITDKNGKQLKQVNVSGSGNGTVNIDASVLSSGAYNYSLIVDGKVISSKQMVVGK